MMKPRTERHFFKATFESGEAVRVFAISKEVAEKRLEGCGCNPPSKIEQDSWTKPNLPSPKLESVTKKRHKPQGLATVKLPFKI